MVAQATSRVSLRSVVEVKVPPSGGPPRSNPLLSPCSKRGPPDGSPKFAATPPHSFKIKGECNKSPHPEGRGPPARPRVRDALARAPNLKIPPKGGSGRRVVQRRLEQVRLAKTTNAVLAGLRHLEGGLGQRGGRVRKGGFASRCDERETERIREHA